MGRQSAMVSSYGIYNGCMPLILGVVVLPIMYAGTLLDLPESMSLLGFFFGASIVPGDHADLYLRETWWVFYGVALVTGLSFLFWSLVGFLMRRVTRFAYPLPPPHEGGRPGCRVCGAALTGDGMVQRCGYCRADHIVMGGRYQRHAHSVERALDAMEAQLDKTLAQRDRWGKRLEQVTMGASLGALILLPVAAFFIPVPTAPVLWWIPVAATALAFVADRLQRRWLPVPNISQLWLAHVGERIVLAGQAYTVVGRVAPGGAYQGEKPVVLMLADAPQAAPCLAIVCYAQDDASERVSVRKVVSQVPEGDLSQRDHYWLKNAQGESLAHVELSGVAVSRVVAATPGAPDQVQTWTLGASTVEASDIYLVQTSSR